MILKTKIYVVDYRNHKSIKETVEFLSEQIKNYKRTGDHYQSIYHAKNGQIFFEEMGNGYCG